MKKILVLIMALATLAGCGSKNGEVPYTVMERYFVRNDAPHFETAVLRSQAELDSLFGMAAVMGRDGSPTPVDFSNETVIAIADEVTSVRKDITPVSLTKNGKTLTFTYKESKGDSLGYSVQPCLLVKFDKSFDQGNVEFIKDDTSPSRQ